jgi:hypothetical protein
MKNSLTINQEFQIAKIKRILPQVPRKQLEVYLLQSLIKIYVCKNTYEELINKELGIEELNLNIVT